MHILIIPSEHFLTPRYPLGGIFQMHQAKALKNAGNRVGIISVGILSSCIKELGDPKMGWHIITIDRKYE